MILKLTAAIVYILVLLAGLFALVFAADKLYDVYEVNRCDDLKEQSIKYAGSFYLTTLEADMCTAHNIIISAPIK